MTVEELYESLLDEEQPCKLAAVLRTDDEDSLRDALGRVVAAPVAEYIEMLLEQLMPTHAAEEKKEVGFDDNSVR